MRDLTKAFFSFSWAMSMFGLEQLNTLISDNHSGRRKDQMTADLDAIAKATSARCGTRTRGMFDSGDQLQQEMTDLVFDLFRGENVKPRKVLDRAADLAESSADMLRDVASETKKKKKAPARRTRRASTRATASAAPPASG